MPDTRNPDRTNPKVDEAAEQRKRDEADRKRRGDEDKRTDQEKSRDNAQNYNKQF